MKYQVRKTVEVDVYVEIMNDEKPYEEACEEAYRAASEVSRDLWVVREITDEYCNEVD